MGYVHDKLCILTTPFQSYGTVATWAIGAGEVAGTIVNACDATDEAVHLFISLNTLSHIPGASGIAEKGFMLETIELDYNIKTAAADALSVVVNKVKRGADGAVAVVSTPAFTYDSGHDSAAERLTLNEHKMVLTITTPEYIEDDEYYIVDITIDKAATTIFQFLSAFCKGTLRL